MRECRAQYTNGAVELRQSYWPEHFIFRDGISLPMNSNKVIELVVVHSGFNQSKKIFPLVAVQGCACVFVSVCMYVRASMHSHHDVSWGVLDLGFSVFF